MGWEIKKKGVVGKNKRWSVKKRKRWGGKNVGWEKRWGGKRHLWFAAAVDGDTTLTNAALSPGTQGSADSVGKIQIH